jgi:hypothetical protein
MDVSPELVESKVLGRVDESFLCEVIDIFWIDRGGEDAEGIPQQNFHKGKRG